MNEEQALMTNMFPDLDLTDVFNQLNGMDANGLANYIAENMNRIPRKNKKRKLDLTEEEDPLADITIELEEKDQDLLIDRLFADLLHHLERYLGQNPPDCYPSQEASMRRYFEDRFPSVRVAFITRIVTAFQGRVVPCFIACFLSENRRAGKLSKYVPSITEAAFWVNISLPIIKPRYAKMRTLNPEIKDVITNETEEFARIMAKLRKKYPELLLEDSKLSKEAFTIVAKPEKYKDELEFDCGVCYDKFPISMLIFCSSTGSVYQDPTQPSSSRDAYANMMTHCFCRTCVRGYAEQATKDAPLYEGGIGLNCMNPDCKKPISYAEIRHILPTQIRKKLDNRILEENLGSAGLHNLERCKKCNFAAEMEVSAQVNKVFKCLRCEAEFCRLCEREWDEAHFGVSCEELDARNNKDRKTRELEKQMSEAIIRKCPKCNLNFIKLDGCNKMTCRCGMTMCYLCRATKIDYTHFCQHLRIPEVNSCNKCHKKCIIYENPNKRDQMMLVDLQRQAGMNVDIASPKRKPPKKRKSAARI